MAACLDKSRFLDCLKRKRVKITLFDSQVMGVIQRINLNKTVILEDVYDVQSGRKFPGAKLFFGHDIVEVEFPFSANQNNLFSVDETRKSKFQSYGNRRMLDYDGDNEHEDFVNYLVIDEFQEKFGPALTLLSKATYNFLPVAHWEQLGVRCLAQGHISCFLLVTHIQEQKVIGIEAELFGQQEGLCWFKVATKNVVYLFDILSLGGRAFKNGLCMILENRHILKVTHDCRCIARCLRAQFGVSLTNVFDTQVADIMLFYKDTGGLLPDRVSTLQEVVRLHLKVPRSALFPLWTQEQFTKENPEVKYIRPCPPALLKIMAATVFHLLPLRLIFLDALMSDYMILVDSYIGSYQNKSIDMLHNGRNDIELPKEAQELEAVRQERLKWAVHRYSVSDDGFLERYSFGPPLPSQNMNSA